MECAAAEVKVAVIVRSKKFLPKILTMIMEQKVLTKYSDDRYWKKAIIH